MVNSEYSMDIYKSVKISIGTVMKSQEILKILSDHHKTKKMFKHAVKKLSFLIRYVSEQQMCDKAISENGGTLKFPLYCSFLDKSRNV